MIKIVTAISLALLVSSVCSLKPSKKSDNVILKKIVDLLSSFPVTDARRSHHVSQPNKNNKHKPKLLREGTLSEEEIKAEDKQDALIEVELKNSLLGKYAALLQRPYLEQNGKNDYLVMKPDPIDPFVTVVPNAIHYNIEKKCVNWLDDCSLTGIRARLLRGVLSP